MHLDEYTRIAVIVTAISTSVRLRLFVESVQKYYPFIPIYIGIQGGLTPPIDDLRGRSGIKIIDLPFDIGLSAARNALVSHTREPFVLICDDDFIFGPDNGLESALSIFDSYPDVLVVGGRVTHFEYVEDKMFERSEKLLAHNLVYDPLSFTLIQYPINLLMPPHMSHRGSSLLFCDMVPNFCIIKKEVIENYSVRWDEKIKINAEHVDYFLQLKAIPTARIAYYEGFSVEHHRRQTDAYKSLRGRLDFDPYFYEKNKIKWFIRIPYRVNVYDGRTISEHSFIDALVLNEKGRDVIENYFRSQGWRPPE